MENGSYRSALGIAAVLLVALLLYLPALGGAFVYFDSFEIEGNPAVTAPGLWLNNFTHSAQTALAGRGHYYRPLYFLSYWLVYRIAGPRPFAFHLYQISLFLVTAWLLWRLARELTGDDRVALAGTLLWVVHPAHVEAVAWISSLCDAGCALFYLLAFWLFLRAEQSAPRTWVGHFPAAAAFLAALLFKEMAYSFPLLLLAYWLFLARAEPWPERVPRAIPYLAVLCGYLLVRMRVLGSATTGSNPWNISQTVATRALELLGEHTKIFLWPTHLVYGRTTGLQPGPLFPWAAASAAGLLLIFAFRRRAPIPAFLAFFWALTLTPVLHIHQITFPFAADRFSYLPSAGLCLALVYSLFLLIPKRRSFVALSATGIVACLWALQTSRTIPHWHNDDLFSTYSMQRSPRVPIFHNIRGKVLATEYGNPDGAIHEFQAALRLCEPAPAVWAAAAHDAYMGLANVAAQEGRTEEAISLYEKAAARMPANTAAYKQLAALYLRQNQIPTVARYLSSVVRLEPEDVASRFNLGVCWLKLGQYSEALRQFRAVETADPSFPDLAAAEAKAALGRK